MQQIHINRKRVNSIEFEKPEIRVPLRSGSECSFELAIINYGIPTRVHLSVSDSIRNYVTFLQDNPYVTSQEWIPVVVKLPSDISAGEGKIKVTIGYGSHTEAIKVYIGTPHVESKPKPVVDVDSKLTVPQYMAKTPAPKKAIKVSYRAEKIIIPFLMILLIGWILLITFVIKKLDPVIGALSVSIIMIILIVYGIMHFVTSNRTKKEE